MSDKRKMLTPAERVAKLEADLAQAKAKAEAKANRQAAELAEKRAKLVEQINDRQAKVDAIDAELAELGFEAVDITAEAEDDNVVNMPQASEG